MPEVDGAANLKGRDALLTSNYPCNLLNLRRVTLMEGIIYLLNQAGVALAQANAEIGELRARLSELESQEQARTA